MTMKRNVVLIAVVLLLVGSCAGMFLKLQALMAQRAWVDEIRVVDPEAARDLAEEIYERVVADAGHVEALLGAIGDVGDLADDVLRERRYELQNFTALTQVLVERSDDGAEYWPIYLALRDAFGADWSEVEWMLGSFPVELGVPELWRGLFDEKIRASMSGFAVIRLHLMLRDGDVSKERMWELIEGAGGVPEIAAWRNDETFCKGLLRFLFWDLGVIDEADQGAYLDALGERGFDVEYLAEGFDEPWQIGGGDDG